MIKLSTCALALVGLVAVQGAAAQAPPEATGQKTLAATMNVFVYPTEGQDAQQQSIDEAECYNWAVGQTNVDPFDLAKQAEEQAKQAEIAKEQAGQTGKGAGGRGAVGGAAKGAVVGAIAGDTGKGAAAGAAIGGVSGRRRGKKAQAQAEAQVEQQAEAAKKATKEQVDNFKKAFAVCLEARKYMVKS